MQIGHSSQARSVHRSLEETVSTIYMRGIGVIVTEVPANAFTLNIDFSNGNTSIKADFI